MRLISLIQATFRRPQYGLATLFAAITVVSVPLAFWTSREHAYRARLAAVAALQRDGRSVAVQGDDGGADSLVFLDMQSRSLRPDDVVVYVNCSLSNEAVSAIVRLPTLKALNVEDADDDWVAANPPPQASSWSLEWVDGTLVPVLVDLSRVATRRPPVGAIDKRLQKITNLPALEDLDLSGTSVSDVGVAGLVGLPSLRVLSLCKTMISDSALTHLSAMPKLEELDLSRTAVTDEGVRRLAALTSLRVLNLSSTNVSGAGFEDLASLRRLEDLDVSDTSLTDEGARYLAPLASLRSLDLRYTKISGAALAYVAQMSLLRTLYAGSEQVGDEGMEYLANLPKLTELYLSGARVTDAGLRMLSRSDAIENLCLDYCDVSDDGLVYLPRMKSLKMVGLNGTSVSDWGKERLKKLKPDLITHWAGGRR